MIKEFFIEEYERIKAVFQTQLNPTELNFVRVLITFDPENTD